ncbi:MAG TPA: alpha/beta hydrolase [Candidatus Binatia bacterium]|nr:alpha/beta hydrolase [Candidatus Binatia bacterium]
MADLRSRNVMTGRFRTHYTECGGNGPALVLCHGGGPGSSGEAGFGQLMPTLGSKFQVYALDSVGGFGETDPYYPASEGVQSRVDQLEAFMDALCIEKAVVGGNSQGAWVAAKYALEHPDRVERLVLIASNTISGAMGLESPVTEGMKAIRAYNGSEESMRAFLQTIVWNKNLITDELVKLRNDCANRPGAEAARKIFQEGQQKLTKDANLRLKFDMRYTLPKLTIPAICIWGEDDGFAPVALGRQLETMLPNIKFHYVAKAGHQVQNDQPQQVGKLMMDFLAAI